MGFDVGQTFGDYSITALLNAGGMGRVYKVEHCLTKRTEAMKVLASELATEIQTKRFEREMRALARLTHPNIGALHNALHSENQLILLMEYIEGQTLENVFSAGRLPLDTGIGYIRQILSALGYAHRQGIVHRDVAPANVMVTATGEVKLTDFGLSKSCGDSLLTNCGEMFGSLPYAAPERLKGATQPDWRSDLYAVGAILYEHLTGQKPFGANRRLSPVLTDSEDEPQPPSKIESGLSSQWDDIVSIALARNPARRYQSAEEFLDALAQLDQPNAGADLLLPQPRTLGILLALFAVLGLALVALPVINRYRQPTPAIAPRPMHIAAPAFATVATVMTPPVPKPVEVRRPKRAPAVAVIAPDPTPIAPDPTPSAPATSPSAPDPAPSAPDPTPRAPAATPVKKSFWSKLNVFKRKSTDAQGKQ